MKENSDDVGKALETWFGSGTVSLQKAHDMLKVRNTRGALGLLRTAGRLARSETAAHILSWAHPAALDNPLSLETYSRYFCSVCLHVKVTAFRQRKGKGHGRIHIPRSTGACLGRSRLTWGILCISSSSPHSSVPSPSASKAAHPSSMLAVIQTQGQRQPHKCPLSPLDHTFCRSLQFQRRCPTHCSSRKRLVQFAAGPWQTATGTSVLPKCSRVLGFSR